MHSRPAERLTRFIVWGGLKQLVSFVALGVLFFVVIGPISLIMKLFGRDSMNRRYDRTADSYWVAREQHRTRSSYFRQF